MVKGRIDFEVLYSNLAINEFYIDTLTKPMCSNWTLLFCLKLT